MSDPSAVFNPTEDPEAVLAAGPPADWLASAPFAERAAALAAHAVGSVVGQGWLFPPVGERGVIRWLFGYNDMDPATGDLKVSTPLGVVSVTTGGEASLDWRWMRDPREDPEVEPPPADQPTVSPATAALAPWHQVALDRELSALAPAVAAAIAEGHTPAAADASRLAELSAFVLTTDVLEKLADIGGGSPPARVNGAVPELRPEYLARSLVMAAPFESTIVMTEDEWRAAGRDAGIDVTPVLGNGPSAAPDADHDDHVAWARSLGDVLAPLARPQWLVHVDALAGAGRIDLTVAVTGSPAMWTAVCRTDAGTSIGGSTNADAVIAIVREALDADALSTEAPTHFALPASAMDLFASVADLWADHGDAAFSANGPALQGGIATPRVGSWSEAVRHLRPARSTAVEVGAGNEAIRVAATGLELHAQAQVFARRLGRPTAIAFVAIDDLGHPSGLATTAGHVFVRTADRLWTLTPHDAWPTGTGTSDKSMISLAAIGGDDLTTILRTLLAA